MKGKVKGKLYGIGVGPGNPEQLTLQAYDILQQVDVICPASSQPNKRSLALKIVEKAVDITAEIDKLIFPMTEDDSEMQQAWKQAGKKVIDHLENKQEVAFITLGDPLLYSTYIYLLEELKKYDHEFKIETVPGVSAITGCSSCLNLPLASGEEKVAVMPVSAQGDSENLYEEISEILQFFDTLVLLKVSRDFRKIRETLADLNLKQQAVLISRYGQSQEQVITDIDKLDPDEIDYLSSMVITRNSSLKSQKGAQH